MNVFNQPWHVAKRGDEIRAKADRMRRREPQALQTLDFVDRLDQLHKGTFRTHFRELMAAIEVDDLAEQGDLPYASIHQATYFLNDFRDWTAPFGATGMRNDAEGAMHVASLHDR